MTMTRTMTMTMTMTMITSRYAHLGTPMGTAEIQCLVSLEPLILLFLVPFSCILLPGWSIVIRMRVMMKMIVDDCNDIGATDAALPCALLLHLA